MKKAKFKRAVLLVLLLTCLLSSCGTKTTEHSIGDLTITLPDHFLEFDCEGYTACFEGNGVAVFNACNVCVYTGPCRNYANMAFESDDAGNRGL